MSDSDRIWGI